MAKPEWGTKRICQSCAARFYDFSRSPITCPACGAVFDLEVASRVRRTRPVPRAEPDDVEAVAEDRRLAPADATVEEAVEDEEDVDGEVVLEEAGDEEEEDDATLIEDTGDLGDDEEDMSDVIDEEVEGDPDESR